MDMIAALDWETWNEVMRKKLVQPTPQEVTQRVKAVARLGADQVRDIVQAWARFRLRAHELTQQRQQLLASLQACL